MRKSAFGEILAGYINSQLKFMEFLREQEAAPDVPVIRGDVEMTNEEARNEKLPAVVAGDGFDDGGNDGDRLIQGVIAACIDGVWSARDELELPSKLIVLATKRAVQHWKDRNPIETITTLPLPDVGELNAAIPEEDWEPGIDDKPRPPWQLQHVVYLLDPKTASIFTYLNSTAGAAIAVRELKDKVKMMRALRGANVVPVVELSAKPMKTRFGVKQRPFFKIADWRDLGGELQTAIASPPQPALDAGTSVKPVTIAEEFNDALPF